MSTDLTHIELTSGPVAKGMYLYAVCYDKSFNKKINNTKIVQQFHS